MYQPKSCTAREGQAGGQDYNLDDKVVKRHSSINHTDGFHGLTVGWQMFRFIQRCLDPILIVRSSKYREREGAQFSTCHSPS
jgi:hypothetical protein